MDKCQEGNFNLKFKGVIQLPVYKDNKLYDYILIDETDEKVVSRYILNINNDYIYTHSSSLYRLLLGDIPNNKTIYHINGNKFDNRKCNLKIIDKPIDNKLYL